MRLFVGNALIASSVALVTLGLTTWAQAETIRVDAHGIRHVTITEGPLRTKEAVGSRMGTGTYYYTYSFINVRDAVDKILSTAHLSQPNSDVTNLVAAVKGGSTSLLDLSNLILGPNGVGDANLPAGFHGHDPNTWRQMGFYSDNWGPRCGYAEQAMGGGYSGGDNLGAAESYVQTYVNNGTLPTWDSDSLVNSHGGVDWYVWDWSKGGSEDTFLKSFNTGSFAPHLVGVFVRSPGQAPIAYFHESDERTYSGPDVACTYIASSYFLSQTQRWLNAQSTLASLGAPNLAAQSFNFARDDAGILADFGDPLVLDLNHNKIVDVTGRSSAIVRAKKNLRFNPGGSVLFDMYGAGVQKMEWIRSGDGFLVDSLRAKAAIQQGRPFDGRDLMGDAEGLPGGFNKLANFDTRHAGKIVGPDLDRLAVWIDRNGNGRYDPGELVSLKDLGITEIDYRPRIRYDKDHEPLEQASFVQRGKRYTIQEVWFAFEPKHLASKGGN